MNTYLDRPLFVKSGGLIHKVNTQDILYIESERDYMQIHTKVRPFRIHSTAKEMLARLPSERFMQVNRSFIVRIDAISTVTTALDEIIMNDKRIPIGTTYKAELKKKLQVIEDQPSAQT